MTAHTETHLDDVDTGGAKQSWWTGRSGLIFPGILAAFASYLLYGQLTMDVAPDTDPPGPGFFPGAIIALLYLFAVLLAIGIIRKPQLPEDVHSDLRTAEISVLGQGGPRWYSDWSRVAWAVGGFVAFILLLQPLGWIIAAGLLFWTMARAFASPTPLRDILVSLTFSSVLYLLFAGLLSVNLPAGSIFGGGI
ncbi:tripartite tricarboxylate transporter TctB family protein [Pseudoclavibacter terrae]|uniref:Tripartite tricarboxylate transporter TctB family protein n=1 Tax=Pseudoclavibacter terrae TaxID=1530195 RepID=A0A7J5B5M1_9MICO|nr:tripartite tricarboxylate transporter TctB family protein [Pseudoclavibacter terrae]KAB1639417.1 tripartite tricarboxylate transporter TctB family protein [Pseudoclavibacter terrae]